VRDLEALVAKRFGNHTAIEALGGRKRPGRLHEIGELQSALPRPRRCRAGDDHERLIVQQLGREMRVESGREDWRDHQIHLAPLERRTGSGSLASRFASSIRTDVIFGKDRAERSSNSPLAMAVPHEPSPGEMRPLTWGDA